MSATKVKFVKGNITGNNTTYTRLGTGNIEFDSNTNQILLDGVSYSKGTQSNWNETNSSSAAYILNKPNATGIDLSINYGANSSNYAVPEASDSVEEAISKLHKYVSLIDDRISETLYNCHISWTGITLQDIDNLLSCTDTYASGSDLTNIEYFFTLVLSNNGATTYGHLTNNLIRAINLAIIELDENGENIPNEGGVVVDSIEELHKYNILSLISEKQDILESGTNIKTINNLTLLGSGNIDVKPLIVNVSYDDNTDTYTATKTYALIVSAIENQPVLLKYDNKYWQLSSKTNSYVVFSNCENLNGNSNYGIYIYSDGLIELLEISQALSNLTTLVINTGTSTTGSLISAKTLRDNFYTESEIDDKITTVCYIDVENEDWDDTNNTITLAVNLAKNEKPIVLKDSNTGSEFILADVTNSDATFVGSVVDANTGISVVTTIFLDKTTNTVSKSYYNVVPSGTSVRNINSYVDCYFNTTYNKMMYHVGNLWVDALGNPATTNYVYTTTTT